jgi:hypothetical protein
MGGMVEVRHPWKKETFEFRPIRLFRSVFRRGENSGRRVSCRLRPTPQAGPHFISTGGMRIRAAKRARQD